MLLLLQVTIVIIFLIAGMVLSEFIKTKDGELRKIMISYFACELWKYIIAIVILVIYNTQIPPLVLAGIFIMILPKAIIKIWLFIFLTGKK